MRFTNGSNTFVAVGYDGQIPRGSVRSLSVTSCYDAGVSFHRRAWLLYSLARTDSSEKGTTCDLSLGTTYAAMRLRGHGIADGVSTLAEYIANF